MITDVKVNVPRLNNRKIYIKTLTCVLDNITMTDITARSNIKRSLATKIYSKRFSIKTGYIYSDIILFSQYLELTQSVTIGYQLLNTMKCLFEIL